ncbi:hypothetical protein B0H11DRAFT_2184323 [Mycena galericulata]|nr:hypothetical protein B0H11DRAFT_2184323 [Mycena galericulata]
MGEIRGVRGWAKVRGDKIMSAEAAVGGKGKEGVAWWWGGAEGAWPARRCSGGRRWGGQCAGCVGGMKIGRVEGGGAVSRKGDAGGVAADGRCGWGWRDGKGGEAAGKAVGHVTWLYVQKGATTSGEGGRRGARRWRREARQGAARVMTLIGQSDVSRRVRAGMARSRPVGDNSSRAAALTTSTVIKTGHKLLYGTGTGCNGKSLMGANNVVSGSNLTQGGGGGGIQAPWPEQIAKIFDETDGRPLEILD